MSATMLDRRLYEAAQGKGGPWALDVDKETSEPMRVRYDGMSKDPRVGVASVLKLAGEDSYVAAGRRAKAAQAALKRARAEWRKAMADRERWGMGE